jgi:predicted enzyme related to lactoylglutathione lyase
VTSFRWNAVCIDCAPDDVDRVVAFYSALLGLQVADVDRGWTALRDPSGGMGINVQAEDSYVAPVWPDQAGLPAKMMHFEIEVSDVAAAAARATSLGATEAHPQPTDRDPALLRVMVDPAGHPFCLWS